MRPSTILLSVLTAVFGVATIVMAVALGADADGFVPALRLGLLVTVGFGLALYVTVSGRRRRQRLQDQSEAHPGTEFVNAHATESTAAELEAWSPGLDVGFPCELGFDRDGMSSWRAGDTEHATPIASRAEVLGFEPFHESTPLGSTQRWGIAISLAPRDSGPATVHVWTIDDQPHQDEYAMRKTITRLQSALRA